LWVIVVFGNLKFAKVENRYKRIWELEYIFACEYNTSVLMYIVNVCSEYIVWSLYPSCCVHSIIETTW